eukprot:TRINITY_DN895_c0_g1_i1.p2 TRINITY_DN895_c0_g1~~TRINITY_DN895_c0_g1_i1.p2  ORF type:complete len:108 (-),score=12.21 TRINITY_DN895_c0_g1_i1:348-671(-)
MDALLRALGGTGKKIANLKKTKQVVEVMRQFFETEEKIARRTSWLVQYRQGNETLVDFTRKYDRMSEASSWNPSMKIAGYLDRLENQEIAGEIRRHLDFVGFSKAML